ncbi:uncharacterized protein CC84DRAFT_1162492 [Paraphaeosphaeria sporulosa]|uniref:Uncharacterized protein n=1 Tax=Paraphaeosphaeria sporulosa TaxID=1460663 RepID=A0A177CMT8_9PLEO|nr:uncharacterized protein CC84DRAFT_1162492 [Paraphaeosphaeria sporulosa]OAG08561.1 hypothetical protein CC84DRAFT_1162492 [Paraphaeosphaeria sporulosa]
MIQWAQSKCPCFALVVLKSHLVQTAPKTGLCSGRRIRESLAVVPETTCKILKLLLFPNVGASDLSFAGKELEEKSQY